MAGYKIIQWGTETETPTDFVENFVHLSKKILPQVGWEKTIWKFVQWNSMKHHFFFKMFLKEVLFSEQLWQFILLYLEQVKM